MNDAEFSNAYAEHHAELLAVTTARCGSVQTAADIVAETWAKAWKRRASYDPARGSVGAWLHQICRTTLVDHYRARRVTLPLLTEPPAPIEAERPDWEWALDKLPERWADAVRAVYLDERTYAEAARALGCPVSTMYSWATLGIGRLRKIMGAAAA